MTPTRATGGPLWRRLVQGARWSWQSDDYRAALPPDFDDIVMAIESRDRLHAKQGRSTARVRFDSHWGGFSAYLKRHTRLPWTARIAALLHPGGCHSPAAREWLRLNQARAAGIPVPDPVAAGERIGPWGGLESYLLVAELTEARELNEVLPGLVRSLPPPEFARLKRGLVIELAELAARLHNQGWFHKDLYLCHVFLGPAGDGGRLTLIDLHRMRRHRLLAWRWRWKDLGQLLFSTFGVEGVDDRDRLRFWAHYRARTSLRAARWQRRMIVLKAARYQAHNQG